MIPLNKIYEKAHTYKNILILGIGSIGLIAGTYYAYKNFPKECIRDKMPAWSQIDQADSLETRLS